jgi:hypothetical protein
MNQKTENPFGELEEQTNCPKCGRLKNGWGLCWGCVEIKNIDKVLKQIHEQIKKERIKKWK